MTFKGKKAYWLAVDENAIKRDIYENGPLEAAFTVFADFMSYKSGKYDIDKTFKKYPLMR